MNNNPLINKNNNTKKDSSSIKNTFGHNPLNHGISVTHAISGEKTKYITGDNSELNMFRVVNCNGTSGESTKFYYSSPEQYEQFKDTTVSQATKNCWLKRTIIL